MILAFKQRRVDLVQIFIYLCLVSDHLPVVRHCLIVFYICIVKLMFDSQHGRSDLLIKMLSVRLINIRIRTCIYLLILRT